jgi:hypothetical protein
MAAMIFVRLDHRVGGQRGFFVASAAADASAAVVPETDAASADASRSAPFADRPRLNPAM